MTTDLNTVHSKRNIKPNVTIFMAGAMRETAQQQGREAWSPVCEANGQGGDEGVALRDPCAVVAHRHALARDVQVPHLCEANIVTSGMTLSWGEGWGHTGGRWSGHARL